MEEKKKRNVNIIVILLIVVVVVNVAMSGYICYDKVNDKKVVAEYEANASDMQKKIDDLQKSVNDMQTDSDENEDDSDYYEWLQNEFYEKRDELDDLYYSDEDIVDIASRILFIKGASEMNGTVASDYPEFQRSEPSVQVMINDFLYDKCDVLYSDVVKKYSKIFTGNALDEFLSIRFADVDGYLYVMQGGASGWSVRDVKLTRVSESNGEIKYNVSYVSRFGFVEPYEDIEGTCTMTVKLVDGSYRISEFDYLKK